MTSTKDTATEKINPIRDLLIMAVQDNGGTHASNAQALAVRLLDAAERHGYEWDEIQRRSMVEEIAVTAAMLDNDLGQGR